ncbi:MAG: 2-dehydropantoate 2-reductase N-terminal domain-containing protein, partial [Burkholderiaceae bacterium]
MTEVTSMRIGVVGVGAIALAMAAWLARSGHDVRMWSPRAEPGRRAGPVKLTATGVVEIQTPVTLEIGPARLVEHSEVLLIAVPVNAHRAVMDALLPHLREGLTVLVSSMASLSALYLFESARARGCDITVASFGTTVLTARREGPMQVRVMTRRKELGVSSLPCARQESVLRLCGALFGEGFRADSNALATTLSNI